jgi:hypothetical protein
MRALAELIAKQVLNPAVKAPNNPVIRADRPWEIAGVPNAVGTSSHVQLVGGETCWDALECILCCRKLSDDNGLRLELGFVIIFFARNLQQR